MHKLLLIILLASSLQVMSQAMIEKPEIYVGPTFGVTGSMVMFSPSVGQTYLQGYNGGVVFRFIAEKNVGIQAELNYSQRGWNESNGLYTRQLNYIELPFMTHLYFGKKSRFFFNLGPKISYLISEKVLLNNTTNSTQVQETTKIQNQLDYGLCTGPGFLINIKGNVIQLDARANYSLSDIFSNDKRDYFSASNNLNVSINLSWLFQIK